VERAVFVPDLERIPPPGHPYDRLYLGSEFCVFRLPDAGELREAHAAAAGRGVGFSLVTPFLDEPGLARVLALTRALPQDAATEVIVNDLGLLEALRECGWRGTLVAGRLLTRQRRGPGFQSFGAVPPGAAAALQGSALDAPAFVELLVATYGVRRFELDDLVQGFTVPDLPAGVSLSLYRPYLLVTATRNCPWIFEGQTWDRSGDCGQPCRGQSLHLTPVQAAGSCLPPLPRRRGGRCATPSVLARSCAPPGAPAPRHPSASPVPAPPESEWDVQDIPVSGRRRGGAEGRSPSPQRSEDDGGPQRQDPAACTVNDQAVATGLILGGCAQFLEHRSDDPPPAGINRVVWQPGVPA
jgi:hypothetical protein